MADNTNIITILGNDLFDELSQLIEQSKQQVAVQANSAVTILFWQVGNRINQNILLKLSTPFTTWIEII